MPQDIPRKLYLQGAVLFGLGALTGIGVSAAFTGKVDANSGFMLAAHLNALMGCFWLICLGVTWDRISLSAGQAMVLRRCTLVAAYANWAVTLVKSLLNVQGIDYLGQTSNDIVFGVLTLTVVIPTFIASGLWIHGLWRPERSP